MPAIYLLALIVLSAGFAKLMAMWVNWICAQRLAKKLVMADKSLNLLLITAYPTALVYGLGWSGPRLLANGSPAQISPLWWFMIGLGCFGFVALIGATIRYWRYRPPACEVSVINETVDLRVDTAGHPWRNRFIGSSGRMRRVALLPGNEQFTIEVSTKTYELPGLPADWDGLSIVHLSDFHFYGGVARAYFEVVCERAANLKPDLFVFSGDLLDDPRLLDWLPETLGKLTAPLGQYFVLGNHDWYLDPNAARREMQKFGWTDLATGTVRINSKQDAAKSTLVLCGDETPWMGTHPNLSEMPPKSFRILVSHTPDNVGWARSNGIDLMLSGHTHGGQIRLPILGPVYSPSRHGCRFASGTFWLDPTLLYVSRGISGKEPVRYNCAPEVTKLVLRPAPGAAL